MKRSIAIMSACHFTHVAYYLRLLVKGTVYTMKPN